MYTSMDSAPSFLLLTLIPAAIAYPNAGPPISSSIPLPQATGISSAQTPIGSGISLAQPPIGTGNACVKAVVPKFPEPINVSATPDCSVEGSLACTPDEISLVTCKAGKWSATNCGQKDGYQQACRSYSNLMIIGHCRRYGPVYTECTGYEDADVHERVSSLVGWDAQATPSRQATQNNAVSQTISVPKASSNP